MTEKTKHLGRESGKSSTRWFGGGGSRGLASDKHGWGARAGDGKTTDKSILGKIIPKFLKG